MSDDVTLVCRVRTGHGNLEKSWYSEIKMPGLEKSWNLKYCLKSWKGHGISKQILVFLKKFYFSCIVFESVLETRAWGR